MSTKKKLVKVLIGYQLPLITFCIVCRVEGIVFILHGNVSFKDYVIDEKF